MEVPLYQHVNTVYATTKAYYRIIYQYKIITV